MEQNHNLEKITITNVDGEIVSEVKIKTEDDELTRQVFYFDRVDGGRADRSFEIVSAPIPVLDESMGLMMINPEDSEPEENKVLVDLGEMRVKEEIIGSESHFVKYKPDGAGKSIKIWQCGICQKEFGHQYILMRHLPTHTDERKYECKQCGKAFRQMSTLSQHRAIHSKLRPYICDVCQKTFNRVSTLISHRKTHTGMKPHRCHLCNKAFHQKGNLRNHIFTHTNERPYKCDVCQKGFNQMSNLMCHKFKAHQRVDRPKYQCPTCGKQFDRRIGLRNHEQYEHGETSAASMMGLQSNGVASSGEGSSTMIVGGGRAITTPSVKYTTGVEVPCIQTVAMKHAMDIGQVPFALLKPLEGIPVLCRVFSTSAGHMLTPATAADLKKYCAFTPRTPNDDHDDEENSTQVGTVRIPVVASIVQSSSSDGRDHFDILDAGGEECAPPRVTDPIAEYDESLPIEHDANMYEAAASLIDLRMRPLPIEVDSASVQMFSHDEIDIDITNSVIDLEKDHNAYGMISKKGFKRFEEDESDDFEEDDENPFFDDDDESDKLAIDSFDQSSLSGDDDEPEVIGTISPAASD